MFEQVKLFVQAKNSSNIGFIFCPWPFAVDRESIVFYFHSNTEEFLSKRLNLQRKFQGW